MNTTPTRHPPEVIEAAIYVSTAGDRAEYKKHVRTLLGNDPGQYGFLRIEVIEKASGVLRDALACAEAERDSFVDVVKEGKFPYTTEAAVVICSHVFGSYRRVTTNLQDCVQKYRLGFAGEPVDEILCREYAAERQRRERAERELSEARTLLSEIADVLESDVEDERYDAHKKIVQFFDAASEATKGAQ